MSLVFVFASFCVLSSSLSAAQLRPGTLENQFEKPVKPRSSGKTIVPSPTGQPLPEEAAAYRFVLKSLRFAGGTVYSEDELGRYYQDYIGQEISVETLFSIASDITKLYANDGYALSLAYVPAQEIGEEGNVRLVIVEGYIGEISYQGDVEQLSARAKRLFDVILAEKPLTVGTLERQLLLANDLPGLTFITTLDRSTTDVGATRLVVDLYAKDFGYSIGLNNRGSEAQGPWRVQFGVNGNNLLIADSTIGFYGQRASHSDEMQFYALNYGLVVADNGLRLNLQASLSESKPDIDILQSLEYETSSKTYGVSLHYPFVRSRHQNLDTLFRLDIKQSDSHFFGETNTDEKTRVLRIGATYDWIDDTGATNLIKTVVSQGLDIFDATDNDSDLKVRDAAEYHFTALRVDLSRNQWLTNKISLFTTISGQYASDPLAPSEQLGWGGEFAGRAYDSFEISGDYGVIAGLELRQTWNSPIAKINYVQPYLFLEGAKMWTERSSILGGGTDHVDAFDYGLGVRGQVDHLHYVVMECVKPGDRDVAQEGDNDVRFFIGWQMMY